MDYKDLPSDLPLYCIYEYPLDDKDPSILTIDGYLNYIYSKCAFDFEFTITHYNDFLFKIIINLKKEDIPNSTPITRTLIIDPDEVTIEVLAVRFLDAISEIIGEGISKNDHFKYLVMAIIRNNLQRMVNY